MNAKEGAVKEALEFANFHIEASLIDNRKGMSDQINRITKNVEGIAEQQREYLNWHTNENTC